VLKSFKENHEFEYVQIRALNRDAKYGLEHGALMMLRLREIAKQLNDRNGRQSWTPRRVDMVLFAARGD
jgi:hypothetical protein